MILTHWNKLINTECVVIQIGNNIIYPIFKNASTNLFKICDKTFINEEINKFDLVTVFMRDPAERFTSGVNKYCNINNLDIKTTVDKIHDGVLVDRHFAPQWVWLLHLYRYYKKQVILKPMSAVKQVCKITNKKFDKHPVLPPVEFIKTDQLILEHMEKIINLDFLIKECKLVLS